MNYQFVVCHEIDWICLSSSKLDNQSVVPPSLAWCSDVLACCASRLARSLSYNAYFRACLSAFSRCRLSDSICYRWVASKFYMAKLFCRSFWLLTWRCDISCLRKSIVSVVSARISCTYDVSNYISLFIFFVIWLPVLSWCVSPFLAPSPSLAAPSSRSISYYLWEDVNY